MGSGKAFETSQPGLTVPDLQWRSLRVGNRPQEIASEYLYPIPPWVSSILAEGVYQLMVVIASEARQSLGLLRG